MGQQEPGERQEREDPQESREAFPCEYCGSHTYEDVVKAALWGSKGLVAIEDIPARVCEGCGEQFYGDETTRRIKKAIADPSVTAKQEVPVPVFSLAEVEVPESGTPREALDEDELEAIESAIESMFTGTQQGRQELQENQESQEPFPCKYCQSNTYEEIVKSALWPARGLVAIEDVPARVCQECREQFYDDETTRKIVTLTEHGFPAEKAKREILVPVFSLGEVEVTQRDSRPLTPTAAASCRFRRVRSSRRGGRRPQQPDGRG